MISRLIIAGLVLASLGTVFGVSADPDPRYPASWWEPAPRAGAPDWEILPQDVGQGEVILSKRTELGILSNFAVTPITIDGKTYPSLEGFWQMMKYPEGAEDPRWRSDLEWEFTREQVSQMTGFDAKRAGSMGSKNMEKLDINWVSYEGRRMTYRTSEKGDHYNLIKQATWAKVRQNPEVKRILLATGDLILRPDHHQQANTPPAWKYFELWMEIRAVIQQEKGE